MFLSHKNIEEYIDKGLIKIKPEFSKKNIRPVWLRIHLGKTILIPEPNQVVNLTESNDLKYKEIDISKEEFYLNPWDFVLWSTYEIIQVTKNILTILDGRSTIARLWLTTHITALTIDWAYLPHSITLEMKNVGNFKIRLKYKDPIWMLLFAELKDNVEQDLQNQYIYNLDKIAPPNLNFKTWKDK